MKTLRFIRILLICLGMLVSFSGYPSTNDSKIAISKIKVKHPHFAGPLTDELSINTYANTFTLTFSTPQGNADIQIMNRDGKMFDSFSAPTDAPIVWFMPEYEGYTITISTDYAEYVAEL